MIGSGFSFGLGTTLGRVAARGVSSLSYIKDNLKLFFNFENTNLEHVGTGSAEFNGTNSKVVAPDDDSLDVGTNSFTIAAWIYSESGSTVYVATKGDSDGTPAWKFLKHSGDDDMFLGVNDASGNESYIYSDETLEQNRWYHVAGVCNRITGVLKVYVNGKNVGGTQGGSALSSVGSLDNTGGFTIGTRYDDAANRFPGKIKNVGYWKRVLSDNEIQNIVYKQYSNLQGSELTHLLGWWALESDANDSTENNNGVASNIVFNTTIYGNNTPTKPRGFDNAPTAQADLIGSGSASFNGTDDYINCGDADNFSFGNESSDSAFSWSLWIKFPSGITESNFIISKDNSSYVEYQLAIDTNFKIVARCHDSALEKQRGLTGTTVLSANTWHHIAWTYDGTGGDDAQNGMNIYLNGVLETVSAEIKASSYIAMHSTSAPLYIGLTDRILDLKFKGNIAQVGLWNAVLTQEQIQSISQKTYSELSTNEKTNVDGSGGALVSWWGLDSVVTATMRTSSGSDAMDMVTPDLHNGETLGSELFLGSSVFVDNDLYFNPYDNNTMTYTSNSVTITHDDNTAGALWFFNNTTNPVAGHLGLLSSGIEAGSVYKITIDLTSDDTNVVLLSQGSATGNIYSTSGNGTKTFYILGKTTGSTYMRLANLSAGTSATLSNFSVKKVTQHHGFLK